MSRNRSGAIFSRTAVYGVLGVVCLGGVVLVLALRRPPAPATPAAVALGVIGLLSATLVALEGRGGWIAIVRLALLAAVGGLAAPVGAFFGVNAAWAAVLALALTFAGLAAARPQARSPGSLAGWVVYATVAGGQLVVMVLIASRRIGDDALVPALVPGHPLWHHVLAHLGLQGVYLGAFIAGLALGRRHLGLRSEIEAATRAAATREALVEEARAEYARALEAVRRGAEPSPLAGQLLRRASGRPATEELDGRDPPRPHTSDDRSDTERRPPPAPEPASEDSRP